MTSNAALARRWFEEVWNQQRAQTVEDLAAPDIVIHGLAQDGQPKVGREHFYDFMRVFRSALGDIRVTVDDVLTDGDQTAARLTVRATHTGDGFGVPPTGRPITATAIVITRWRDGQIVEGWNEFDAAGMLRQITAPAASTLRA